MKTGRPQLVLGLGLVVIGAVFNEALIARIVSADGHLASATRIEIGALNVAAILLGIVIAIEKRISSPRVVLTFSVLVLAFGTIVGYLEGFSVYGPQHASGNDDAYISYRYARNFAHGHGLVFNPGERVEGYTDLLYVLLMAPVLLLGDSYAYSISTVLNFLLLLLGFFLFFSFAKQRLGEEKALVAAVLFAMSPILWLWTASGMEIALVVLLQIAVWATAENVAEDPSRRRIGWLCAVTVLCVLVRADGFITPGIAVLYLLLRGRYRAATVNGLVLGVAMLALFTWRYQYYGYIFPNTYYVKVAGPLTERMAHAVRLLGKVALASGLFVSLMFLGVRIVETLAAVARDRSFKETRFDALFAGCLLAYWIYVGGDHFEERFLVILGPVGIFVLLSVVPRSDAGKRVLLYVVPLVLVAQMLPLFADGKIANGGGRDDVWITLGKFLEEKHPDAYLATAAAGKIPFFSRLRTLDMLGLNDEFIGHMSATAFLKPGHNKWNEDYVLERKPDLIATWIRAPERLELSYGLTSTKYTAAGYRFKYLVNLSLGSRGRGSIIDVSGKEDAAIRELASKSYRYAVLERQPSESPSDALRGEPRLLPQ